MNRAPIGLQDGDAQNRAWAPFHGGKEEIFFSCGDEQATRKGPAAQRDNQIALAASDPWMIQSVIGPDEIHLQKSDEQHDIVTGTEA
jgi:hypothetical protein